MNNKDMNEIDIQEALGTLDQSLDRDTVRAVINDLNKVVRDVVEKHGLKLVKECQGRFSTTVLKINFEVNVRMKGGKSVEQVQFELYSNKYLYPINWFGQKVVLGRATFTISGVNSQKHKNCIRLTRADGKIFKCGVARIRQALGGK